MIFITILRLFPTRKDLSGSVEVHDQKADLNVPPNRYFLKNKINRTAEDLLPGKILPGF